MGDILNVIAANNEDNEAERVVGELIAHHFIKKTRYRDYAIVYRGNHQSRLFEKMLMQKRIPYLISSGTSFFSGPEIKDLLAYLRLLTKLGAWATQRDKSLFTTSFSLGLGKKLSGRGLESLQ